MTKEQFIKSIKEIEHIQREYESQNDKLAILFGRDSTAENSFVPLFFKMRDSAIKHLSTILEDKDKWINWYFDEVLQTDTLLSVTIKGEEIKCGNAFALWEILQKSI